MEETELNRQDAKNAKTQPKTIDTVDALFVDLFRSGRVIDKDLLRIMVRQEMDANEAENIRDHQELIQEAMSFPVGRLRKKLLGPDHNQ